MNPDKVIDRDGDVWTKRENGLYSRATMYGIVPLETVRKEYGPLEALEEVRELPDEDEGKPEEVPTTSERSEALAAAVILARAAHAGEDGHDATDISLTAVDFAKFLLNED